MDYCNTSCNYNIGNNYISNTNTCSTIDHAEFNNLVQNIDTSSLISFSRMLANSDFLMAVAEHQNIDRSSSVCSDISIPESIGSFTFSNCYTPTSSPRSSQQHALVNNGLEVSFNKSENFFKLNKHTF
jgi:hypothetical protein